MPRGIHKDAQHLHEILEKGVILDKDRVDGDSIKLDDSDPVYVGIIVDVTGYGPHVGALYVEQNRFHGSVDGALQGADEILEQWTLDNTSQEDIEELEEKYGDDWMSVLTETFDGWGFKVSAREFVEAVRGTDAEKFVDIEEEEEEEEEEGVLEENVSEPNDARDILEGLGPYMQHEGHDAPRESARIARMIAGVRGNADRADKVLEEVNRLVDGNGIEAIRDENANDRYYGDVVALYVNMGYTYETTLLYDTEEHEFRVTSWGDWYEAYEAEQEEEEPEEDEDPEEDDDVFSREEMDEGYVISDKRGGGYSVSQLSGVFDDMDEALEAIDKDMKKSNVYPNIYYVNDHGNIDLLDVNGNTIRSRV